MKRSFLIYLLAIFLMIFSLLFSLLKGSTPIPLSILWQKDYSAMQAILWKVRIPRTFTAFTCGALLSLSGMLMQLLLQNPLADPYILGISGGAAFCTLIFMLFTNNENFVMSGAILGSLLSICLIFSLTKQHRFHAHSLILIGIALASGFSAGISFLLLLSPSTTIHAMLFWLSGDLNETAFPSVPLLVLILGLITCFLLAPGLNLMARGEKAALSLGLPVTRYRLTLYLLSSILTAISVATCGCIGFIGIVIPHMTRLLIGNDHRFLLPFGCLFGGSFLTIADTFARTILAPMQLPVGILLAFIGVPTFIWLLHNRLKTT